MKSPVQGGATMKGLNIMLVLFIFILPGCDRRDTTTFRAAAGAASISRVGMQSSVPTLYINDHAVAPTSLYVYNVEGTVTYDSTDWLDTFKSYIDKARNIGMTYISFELYFHSAMFNTAAQPVIVGRDLDFSNMDSLFDYAQQQEVYLLPTLWVSSPPEWWAAQNQDKLQLGYDETVPPTDSLVIAVSYNNPGYWKIMDAYVTAVVERYKDHPALLGWSPCVGMTRENNYGPSYLTDPHNPPQSWADYSFYAKGRFRAWLTDAYGTDSALRSAWSDSVVTLATAETPTPLAVINDALTAANGAGDTRREMLDWLNFRLDEKGADWRHFLELVKALDPYHVVVINPADPLLTPIGAIAQNGTADGLKWMRSLNVDMAVIHPRISFDETASAFNTQSYALFSFAAYARRLGKIGTFALEDTGDAMRGDTVESYDRIASLAPMLASAGGGMGWATESSTTGIPVWSDAELDQVGIYTYLYDPSNRSVEVSEIAILLDPMREQMEYPLGGNGGINYRSKDRLDFYQNLYNAGIRVDPIDVAELEADSHVLDQYKGIVIANLARIAATTAQILHDYAKSGRGLFIAGRSGVFDSDGNKDYTAFKALLGLATLPSGSTTQYAAWSFDINSDPLLIDLSGIEADTGNLYYLPVANWEGEGYSELGHASSGDRPATLIAKSKTVAWFPRLGLSNADLTVRFVNRWLASL